jgi:hypothetical protein
MPLCLRANDTHAHHGTNVRPDGEPSSSQFVAHRVSGRFLSDRNAL